MNVFYVKQRYYGIVYITSYSNTTVTVFINKHRIAIVCTITIVILPGCYRSQKSDMYLSCDTRVTYNQAHITYTINVRGVKYAE